MMKKILLSILILCYSLLLVACIPAEPNNGDVYDFSKIIDTKETITLWIDDKDGHYINALIQAFNETPEGKNIAVKYQHMSNNDALINLQTFAKSGNGPDLIQLNRQHLLTAYNDHLIDPLPSSLEVAVTNRIHPLALKTATILHHQTETLFSVPMTLETVVLYYNKLFIETPHSTYEDLLTDALQWNETETSHESGLTNAEQGWYYLGSATQWTDSYLLQHIYSSFDFFPFGLDSNDADEIGFIHAVEPLEWLINELNPIVTGENDDSIDGLENFQMGKIPYLIGHSNLISKFIDEPHLLWDITTLPKLNNHPSKPYVDAQMFSINTYSEKKEAASKFLAFLLNDSAMNLLYQQTNNLPALSEALLPNVEGLLLDPYINQIQEQLQNSLSQPLMPELSLYWTIGNSMINNVWNEKVTPLVATQTAEAAYQSLRSK